MLIAALAILAGFVLLIWSADRFVDGAAVSAKYAGLSPLLIGMLVIGFGTSAPEMLVSALAALDGNTNLALGNAIGSNIVNTSLILGCTALIAPIAVQSTILKKEIPILVGAVLVVGALFMNNALSRLDAWVILAAFFAFIFWSLKTAKMTPDSSLEADVEETANTNISLKKAIFMLVTGLVILIGSSRLLVWGAVEIATELQVSDLIIGLTIVALGTSLPELASSIIAARKGQHDLALGNIIGSNIFNILAVVGIAGAIQPIESLSLDIMHRDWPFMAVLTVAIFFMGIGLKKQGRINRVEGGILLSAYIGYTLWLVTSAL
ncbi:MAG TPA: calcium/sodium antiporter [Gammaproteobacteria bacterium]|nr:calcium/sodium antiporter [Gammaproteobacteria bacterium]HCK92454.1 calcium/sodium antiporter [Gammaproteobacteria bacterium]|tara:strand:- start:1039 stop:2004 length:966 start_codon:yes stop_codon:yes gene_type:complete